MCTDRTIDRLWGAKRKQRTAFNAQASDNAAHDPPTLPWTYCAGSHTAGAMPSNFMSVV